MGTSVAGEYIEGESVVESLDNDDEKSNARFSNITLRAMRVAGVMKAKVKRDIVVSNLRRALRDRAVDLEMALGMVCDWYENKTKLFGDDVTEILTVRYVPSIDCLCD